MVQLQTGIKLIVKIVVSAAFFWVLLSFIQKNELAAVFSNVNWSYVGLSFALTPIMLAVSNAKWKCVLDKSGHVIPAWKLFRIYFIGYFFSNVLPSTVGGDVVRSFYSGRMINNQAFAAVAVFCERFSGLLLLFVLVIFLPLLRLDLYSKAAVYLPAAASALLLVVSVFLLVATNPLTAISAICTSFLAGMSRLANLRFMGSVARLIPVCERLVTFFLNKLSKVQKELDTTRKALKYEKSFGLQIVGLTLAFYALAIVNVYVSYRAFGSNVDIVAICVLLPAALFVAQVPITVLGNLGYFESVFVMFFLMVGVPAAESLAMGLLLRAKMLTLGGIGFVVYIFYKNTHTSADRELKDYLTREQGGKQ